VVIRKNFASIPLLQNDLYDNALLQAQFWCAARRRVSTERTPQVHDFDLPLRYRYSMKRAFVVRLTPEAEPVGGKFEGRVEEVDSGRTLRFRSTEEFLDFLQKCLDNQQPLAD